jgi:hypothetical protein
MEKLFSKETLTKSPLLSQEILTGTLLTAKTAKWKWRKNEENRDCAACSALGCGFIISLLL